MNRKIRNITISFLLVFILLLTGCGDKVEKENNTANVATEEVSEEEKTTTEASEEITTEAVTEAASEETADRSDDSSDESEDGMWCDGVRGCRYFVPAEFSDTSSSESAVHYVYSYESAENDMSITITEALQQDIPNGLDDEYQMYQDNVKYGYTVEYSDKSSDGFVVSGHMDDTVYYNSVKYIDDKYINIEFKYPDKNKDTCDKIVEQFMKDFTY